MIRPTKKVAQRYWLAVSRIENHVPSLLPCRMLFLLRRALMAQYLDTRSRASCSLYRSSSSINRESMLKIFKARLLLTILPELCNLFVVKQVQICVRVVAHGEVAGSQRRDGKMGWPVHRRTKNQLLRNHGTWSLMFSADPCRTCRKCIGSQKSATEHRPFGLEDFRELP